LALIDDLRPKTLDEVIGQENAKRVVRTMIERKKPEHLMLLGPSGTGKTSIAQIAARAITGEEDPGPWGKDGSWLPFNSKHCGNKESIAETVNGFGQRAGLKILIFDEADKITQDSQKLLLNALEMPQFETFYFFCSTEKTKLIYDLRTRCKSAMCTWLTKDERLALIKRGSDELGLAEPPKGFVMAIQDRLGNPRAILQALEAVHDGMPVKDAVEQYSPTPDEMKNVVVGD
jgi:replication-associated recombination protein RarA